MSITGTHHRTGSVVVVNDTGKPVRAVSVVHKYSDNYSDDHVWPDLEPGAESDPMQVRYNTGPFTTGRDWWLVAWMSEDGHVLFHTDPQNFRDVMDAFETAAPAIATLVGVAATSESGGWGGAAGAAIVAPFVNSSKTSGFKQHILREEDPLTRIHIGDRSVVWKSPSGRSETGVARTPVGSETQ